MITFEAFSLQHFLALAIVGVIGWGSIWFAKHKLNFFQRTYLGTALALFATFTIIIRMIWVAAQGEFDVTKDLPFHLCRITAFILPFLMFYHKRRLFGVLYFWIMVGTFNAMITPDLKDGFPSPEFFIYFIYHGVLVIAILYAVFIYKMKPNWTDLFHAFVATNLLLLLMYVVNLLLGSNYFYTMHKPETASMLDYFGPWPWYLLVSEGVALVMMFFALLPFLITRNRSTQYKKS